MSSGKGRNSKGKKLSLKLKDSVSLWKSKLKGSRKIWKNRSAKSSSKSTTLRRMRRMQMPSGG
jgi:hypothetical protein